MTPDVGTKKPRPKYKRLYEAEQRKRMEAEGRLTALRGRVSLLAPRGKDIALQFNPDSPRYVLAPHEWLAFAVWMEGIARYNAPTWGVQLLGSDPFPFLEQSGAGFGGSILFQGKPVVMEGTDGG